MKPPVIQIDTREKPHAIVHIVKHFDLLGIRHHRSKLYVGDYMNLDNARLVVDRKQNLLELAQNVCQGHDRFRNELVRAQKAGIQLIVLVEGCSKVRTIEDLERWKNPRLVYSKAALKGARFAKILRTMEERYGVKFVFCSTRQTPKKLLELLEVPPHG